MEYFGEPLDLLERLSDEVELSAERFSGETRTAVLDLAHNMRSLTPMFVALNLLCCDDNETDGDLIHAYRMLLVERRKKYCNG